MKRSRMAAAGIVLLLGVGAGALVGMLPSAAAPEPLKVNDPLAAGGSVTDIAVSPDSAYVVYLADQEVDGRAELYSRPVDLSTPPVKLNAELPPGGQVTDFLITADSTRVVYRTGSGLHSRAIDGSGPAPLLSTGSVRQFDLAPDGSRVVFRTEIGMDDRLLSRPVDGSGQPVELHDQAGEVTDRWAVSADSARVVYLAWNGSGARELYSRPLDGSGASVKLNGALAGGSVGTFAVSPDGTRVAYLAAQDAAGVYDLHSAPIAGGGPVKISGTLTGSGMISHQASHLRITPDSARVVFVALVDGNIQLFSTPIAGGAEPTALDTDEHGQDRVDRFQIAADGTVLYRANHVSPDLRGSWALYRRAADGTGPNVPVTGAPVSGREVWEEYAISPDSQWVVYPEGTTSPTSLLDLYTAPMSGTGPFTRLNESTVSGGGIVEGAMSITPDSQRVVYLADKDAVGVFELYSKAIEGSGASTKLNDALVGGGDVVDHVVLPDSGGVVYLADQDTDEVVEAYLTTWTDAPPPTTTTTAPPTTAPPTTAPPTTAPPTTTTTTVPPTTAPPTTAPPTTTTAPPTTTTAPPTTLPPTTTTTPPSESNGYWLLEANGDLVAVGDAPPLPSVGPDLTPGTRALALAAHPDGDGLWVLTSGGDIVARGSAVDYGRVDLAQLDVPGEVVTTLAAAPDGLGLWVFTSSGRVIAFGSAPDAPPVGTSSGFVIDAVPAPAD